MCSCSQKTPPRLSDEVEAFNYIEAALQFSRKSNFAEAEINLLKASYLLRKDDRDIQKIRSRILSEAKIVASTVFDVIKECEKQNRCEDLRSQLNETFCEQRELTDLEYLIFVNLGGLLTNCSDEQKNSRILDLIKFLKESPEFFYHKYPEYSKNLSNTEKKIIDAASAWIKEKKVELLA
ncbi:MAG: hypothetical protein NZO16_05805, partial [Deltaproteobacteria bacterium]|nr:hypothetical protein [Deltaproteobacteria bacterium]